MDMKVLKVTPAMAKQMLESNSNYRLISQKHVDRLAAEMSCGRWALNGQAIIFSSESKLLDGQHRLHAIIKSNTTIETAVVYGVDPLASQSYDSIWLQSKPARGDCRR